MRFFWHHLGIMHGLLKDNNNIEVGSFNNTHAHKPGRKQAPPNEQSHMIIVSRNSVSSVKHPLIFLPRREVAKWQRKVRDVCV